MKKTLVLMLVLALVVCSLPAFAAGKLSVEQEDFHVIQNYSVFGYAYAKVVNVGDRPIKINTGLLEIFNADGEALTSTDYYTKYAEYLQPGEYTYIWLYDEVEDVEPGDVDDYLLTATGKADTDYVSYRFPCVASYEPNVEEGYWTYNYMYATFTNDTDEPVYDISIVLALLDADGHILYIDDAHMYSDKAVMPGSSITVRCDVSSYFIEYFEKNGLVPASVDAIAYVNIEQE